MAEKMKWARHAKEIKEKKQLKRKDSKTPVGYNIVADNEMIVQRLACQPTGKSMKYERIGAQEFVPYPYDDFTLDLIKKACYEPYYKQHLIDPLNSTCDILASQNGPSCSKLSHTKKTGNSQLNSLKNNKKNLVQKICINHPPFIQRVYR